MTNSIITLIKNVVRSTIKAPIKKMLALLENACLASPIKSRFSAWYSNVVEKGVEKGVETDEDATGFKPTFEPLKWKSINKVEYSGVCVLSKGKLLMYRPLEVFQRHPDARKAIVSTRNYRPLKYPGSQHSLSLALVRRNWAYWRKGKKAVSLTGSVALLGNCEFDNANYYHFWVDVIADIWFVRQHLAAEELPDYYLVPFANLAWQWDILTLCGIHESQVIPYAKHDVLSLDRLIIPIRDKGALNLPSWLIRAMHDMCGWTPTPHKGKRLIFVSRADADYRCVANESVICNRLREKGFEVHTLKGLSITEQQQLFATAAIICAPHGAALTNVAWCGPGTIIIDFLSEQHLVPCFSELAAQNKLVYYPYICKRVEGTASGLKGDIIVSDSQIDSVLDIVTHHLKLTGEVLES
ncbi:glycosyltransferase family 61 protein [Halomonas sp. QX-2]|uniref:Glycosyltransferase family 61 protein n=1 Tax=Vreelandella sedimenti TaxID=2729618 RepID=A0A7Z0N9Z4_9GAMM|nr:glycosyltransferase family 61 protein [Halomonas sedimenti]NYT74368.1 glycosyltransferase family 61 protein [Halomonas sedimenti]